MTNPTPAEVLEAMLEIAEYIALARQKSGEERRDGGGKTSGGCG